MWGVVVMNAELCLKPFGLWNEVIEVNPNDNGISQDLLRFGFREPLNTFYFSRLLKKLNRRRSNMDVVDIGGNIGYFPMIEGMCFDGRITVFEPVMDTFKYLVRNLGFVHNMRLVNCAVGHYTGLARIKVEDKRNWSHMVEDGDGMGHYFGVEDVDMVSLEDALGGMDEVLLRFDVEGFELRILAGEVPECVKWVVFELHPEKIGFDESMMLLGDLEDQGFDMILVLNDLGRWFSLIKRFGMFPVWVHNQFKKCVHPFPDFDELCDLIEVFEDKGVCPHLYLRRV